MMTTETTASNAHSRANHPTQNHLSSPRHRLHGAKIRVRLRRFTPQTTAHSTRCPPFLRSRSNTFRKINKINISPQRIVNHSTGPPRPSPRSPCASPRPIHRPTKYAPRCVHGRGITTPPATAAPIMMTRLIGSVLIYVLRANMTR